MVAHTLVIKSTDVTALKEVILTGLGSVPAYLIGVGMMLKTPTVKIKTAPLMTTNADAQDNIQVLDCFYDPSIDPTISYLDYRSNDLFGEVEEVPLNAMVGLASTQDIGGLMSFNLTSKVIHKLLHSACDHSFFQSLGRSMTDTLPILESQAPSLCVVDSEFEGEDRTEVTIPVWWSVSDKDFKHHIAEQTELAREESRANVFRTITVSPAAQRWTKAPHWNKDL